VDQCLDLSRSVVKPWKPRCIGWRRTGLNSPPTGEQAGVSDKEYLPGCPGSPPRPRRMVSGSQQTRGDFDSASGDRTATNSVVVNQDAAGVGGHQERRPGRPSRQSAGCPRHCQWGINAPPYQAWARPERWYSMNFLPPLMPPQGPRNWCSTSVRSDSANRS
jgi:hypothetical protein